LPEKCKQPPLKRLPDLVIKGAERRVGGGERDLSPLSLFHNLGFALDESELEP